MLYSFKKKDSYDRSYHYAEIFFILNADDFRTIKNLLLVYHNQLCPLLNNHPIFTSERHYLRIFFQKACVKMWFKSNYSVTVFLLLIRFPLQQTKLDVVNKNLIIRMSSSNLIFYYSKVKFYCNFKEARIGVNISGFFFLCHMLHSFLLHKMCLSVHNLERNWARMSLLFRF